MPLHEREAAYAFAAVVVVADRSQQTPDCGAGRRREPAPFVVRRQSQEDEAWLEEAAKENENPS